MPQYAVMRRCQNVQVFDKFLTLNLEYYLLGMTLTLNKVVSEEK